MFKHNCCTNNHQSRLLSSLGILIDGIYRSVCMWMRLVSDPVKYVCCFWRRCIRRIYTCKSTVPHDCMPPSTRELIENVYYNMYKMASSAQQPNRTWAHDAPASSNALFLWTNTLCDAKYEPTAFYIKNNWHTIYSYVCVSLTIYIHTYVQGCMYVCCIYVLFLCTCMCDCVRWIVISSDAI